jgi:hypothetical protein
MEEDGPFPQAVTRLRALQSAAQVYRRARELSAQDATPVEPTARSAMTPNRGRHTMTTFASPRQLAERELASTIRQLRLVQGGGGAAALDAHSMPAAMRTPASLQTPLESETERRRHAKSHLEAQLLEALDSAAGLGHEREELLDALRAAEATAEAAAAETERLRDEVATLQLELEEERLRAMSAAEELEAEARELAEQLELERARLDEERYTTAVIRAAYEERSAEFEQLRCEVEMLRCRGGGAATSGGAASGGAASGGAASCGAASCGASDPPPSPREMFEAEAEAEAEASAVVAGDGWHEVQGEEAAERASGDDWNEGSAPSSEEAEESSVAAAAAPPAPEQAAAAEATTAAPEASPVMQAMMVPISAARGAESAAVSVVEAEAAAPEAAPVAEGAKEEPPPDIVPTTTWGRNRWVGFQAVDESDAAPTVQFKSKFPLFAVGSSAQGLLVMGGGGGAARNGLSNALLLSQITDEGACVRTALHGTGIEAVAHLAIDAAGTHVATVQGVDVVVYAVDASHRLTAVQRLSLDPPDAPPGLRESTPDPQNLPNAFKPYHACFSPDGKLLAVGMEDGALLLFGASSLIVAAAIAGKEAAADSAVVDVTAEASAARDARPWTLLWRSRQHSKELKAAAFAPDGSLLLTAAPDGKCLAWALDGVPAAVTAAAAACAAAVAAASAAAAASGVVAAPAPREIVPPKFSLFKLCGGGGGGGKRRKPVPQWRSLAIPLEGGTKRAPAPLFGAVNFGAGWVVRCDVRSGRSTSYVKIGSAPLTTLACSSDGRMVAAGDNDGALHLVDGRTLTKLLKVVPHEIWITGLLLRAAPPSGLATLAKATEPRAYTAVTLGGDNTCVFTTVPSTKLKGGGGLLGSPLFWLSVLVLLVALVVQYPGEASIVGARVLSLTHEALRLAGPYLSLPAPVTAPVEAMGQPTGATPMEAQAP